MWFTINFVCSYSYRCVFILVCVCLCRVYVIYMGCFMMFLVICPMTIWCVQVFSSLCVFYSDFLCIVLCWGLQGVIVCVFQYLYQSPFKGT